MSWNDELQEPEKEVDPDNKAIPRPRESRLLVKKIPIFYLNLNIISGKFDQNISNLHMKKTPHNLNKSSFNPLFLFQGAVHFKIVKYERIKFLVIALRDSIEIYAWAPKPYHKFMAFKSFSELQHKPLLVDLTVEEGTRLKVPSLPNLTIDGAGVVAVSIWDRKR